MTHFIEVDFKKTLNFSKWAEFSDIRMRTGEFMISTWLQRNILNFNEAIGFSKYSTDLKFVLVGARPNEDFDIYSQNKKHVINLWAKFKITNSFQLKV